MIAYNIIEDGNRKAGYLCYSDFFGNSQDLFFPVFQEFKSAGVTDVVLDLRYNLGGYLTAARALVGALCPAECLNVTTLLISKSWNDLYQKYWNDNNSNDSCMNISRNFPRHL